MASVDRNAPVRAASSDSQYSLMEFMRQFRDDAACLDHLWRKSFSPDGHSAECPKCERTRRFHRVKSRPSYSCDSCGHHLHPTAGTIFHKSSTSLHLWFYAMYLMASTRCGISAKQLEREIGVSYKTAWRMLNLIRTQLMEQDDEPLSGDVEVDETAHEGSLALMRRAPPAVAGPGRHGASRPSGEPSSAEGASGSRSSSLAPPRTSRRRSTSMFSRPR